MTTNRKMLVVSILLALASWMVPFLSVVSLPLQYLYTHLHEIGHALAGVASGGQGIQILVFADGSGVTSSLGGSQLLLSPAGYVGATIFGGLMLAMASNAAGARLALRLLGGLVAMALLLWIRGDAVGLLTAVLSIVALFTMAAKLKDESALFAATFLGIYQCLASLQAVFSILNFGSVAMQENDAVILERATGIPAILSASVWSLISAAVVVTMVARSWRSGDG